MSTRKLSDIFSLLFDDSTPRRMGVYRQGVGARIAKKTGFVSLATCVLLTFSPDIWAQCETIAASDSSSVETLNLSAYANTGNAQDQANGVAVGRFQSVEAASEVLVSVGTTVNSGSLVVQGAPAASFQKASARATLVVTDTSSGNVICSSATKIGDGEKSTPGGYQSDTFSAVNDSFSLSCRGAFDGVNGGDISAELSVQLNAENYGVGDARALVNLSVGSFTMKRCCLDALQAPSEALVPLFRWYSPSRGDNLLSSQQQVWAGCAGSKRSPDYIFVAKEGFLFDPRAPQPPNTTAIYRWYSPSRTDNLTTTSQQAAGMSAEDLSPDYSFAYLEGYVTSNAPAVMVPANRIPLFRWFSPSRQDNMTTTSQAAAGNAESGLSPDYGFTVKEGYLVRP